MCCAVLVLLVVLLAVRAAATEVEVEEEEAFGCVAAVVEVEVEREMEEEEEAIVERPAAVAVARSASAERSLVTPVRAPLLSAQSLTVVPPAAEEEGVTAGVSVGARAFAVVPCLLASIYGAISSCATPKTIPL